MSPAYKLVETNRRVYADVEMRSFSRSRAERFARRRNAERLAPSYRYEVIREGRRWAAAVFQNVLEPLRSDHG
jgi:hypothetical protein